MTLHFTKESSNSGDEPTELLRALAFEYLTALVREGLAEFVETVGRDGQPILLAAIPGVRVEDGKIVEVANEPPTEPTAEPTEEVISEQP